MDYKTLTWEKMIMDLSRTTGRFYERTEKSVLKQMQIGEENKRREAERQRKKLQAKIIH